MDTESVRELVSASDNRGKVYSFLARMYAKELTEESLKELGEKVNLWVALSEDPEARGSEMARGAKMLADFVSSLKTRKLDDVKLELAAEYAGLFLGVRGTPPHPSESVYLSAERLIMQKSRDDVLKVYRAMGVDKVKAFTEPEDHIAIELEFMAYLCDKTSTALRDGIHAEARKYLECQRDFLKEHLAKWVPLLVADILQGSRRDFYRAVGMITKGYVEMDGEVVQGMIDEIALSHDPKTRAAA